MMHLTTNTTMMMRSRTPYRRGITSVLAMMFLVIFGSLSVAMAIMAQGNLRAADSALHVSRASSAAQTGLVFAVRRLQSEGRRWVVRKGLIDEPYGEALWTGQIAAVDNEVVLLPPDGYTTSANPAGLMEAVMDAHLADDHAFDAEPGDNQLPLIIEDYRLETKPIRMTVSRDEFLLPTSIRTPGVESGRVENQGHQ